VWETGTFDAHRFHAESFLPFLFRMQSTDRHRVCVNALRNEVRRHELHTHGFLDAVQSGKNVLGNGKPAA
jgi:hypothetical protein